MAEAHAQQRDLGGLDRVLADAEVLRGAPAGPGPGEMTMLSNSSRLELGPRGLVVADDDRILAIDRRQQLEEVERERVVVVDQERPHRHAPAFRLCISPISPSESRVWAGPTQFANSTARPMLAGARPRGKPDVRSPERRGATCRAWQPRMTGRHRSNMLACASTLRAGVGVAAPGGDSDVTKRGGPRREVRWYRGFAPRRLPIGAGDPASCAPARDDQPGRRRDGRSCAAPDANVSAGAPVGARYCPKCLRHSAGPSGESSHQHLLPE